MFYSVSCWCTNYTRTKCFKN